MSSFLSQRKLKLKQHLPRNQTRQSTAIPVRIMPSLAIMGHTTTPPRQGLRMVERENFCISNSAGLRPLPLLRATETTFTSRPYAVFVPAKAGRETRAKSLHEILYFRPIET